MIIQDLFNDLRRKINTPNLVSGIPFLNLAIEQSRFTESSKIAVKQLSTLLRMFENEWSYFS